MLSSSGPTLVISQPPCGYTYIPSSAEGAVGHDAPVALLRAIDMKRIDGVFIRLGNQGAECHFEGDFLFHFAASVEGVVDRRLVQVRERAELPCYNGLETEK